MHPYRKTCALLQQRTVWKLFSSSCCLLKQNFRQPVSETLLITNQTKQSFLFANDSVSNCPATKNSAWKAKYTQEQLVYPADAFAGSHGNAKLNDHRVGVACKCKQAKSNTAKGKVCVFQRWLMEKQSAAWWWLADAFCSRVFMCLC